MGWRAASRGSGEGRLAAPSLIGHLEGLALIVGDEQARDMNLVVQFSQPDAKLVANLGVEGPKGLVQEQHLRARRKRPRQGDPLPLAS